jgi:hypothetical protein
MPSKCHRKEKKIIMGDFKKQKKLAIRRKIINSVIK